MLVNNLGQNIPQHRASSPDLQALIGRLNFLRKNPTEQKEPGELQGLINHIQLFGGQGRGHSQQPQPATNGHVVSNGAGPSPASSLTLGPISTQPLPPTSPTPVSFSPDQINVLKAQIHAFKLISKGLPVPDNVQQALRVFDSSDLPNGPFMEGDVNSGIYPYNAYAQPSTHLERPADVDPKLFATRLQRLMIPTIMPLGLDACKIIEERDRFIEARMQQRVRELEAFPSTIGDGGFDTDPYPQDIVKREKENSADKPHPSSLTTLISDTSHGKIRALIELKSLRLLDKQRLLRSHVAETLAHGSLIPLNRPDFRRFRQPTLRDARVTEQLERKQRTERERRAKSRHVEQLDVICIHGRQMVAVNRAAQDRVVRLGRSVLNFHQFTEKEEQKRVERITKERIKALKADDEETYLALVGGVKNTRITHLLQQTDSYLDSLAKAVTAQQNEGGPLDMRFEVEAGPASEATFGAQIAADDVQESTSGKVDYYAVAHRISEKVVRQPSLLVGGTLKEYQLKGLQWMVSLYNNRLNGILADEMGLGKTIQTISLIAFLIETKRLYGPYLVIVPLSTMTNWSGEFAKWSPSIKVVAYKGNPAQRKALQGELRVGQFQVLLTTYEYIIKDRPILCKMNWLHMIIDEGHRMKNTESKLSVTLTTYYHSRHRLLLSGTPLQNNLTELWSLLNFVLPKIFNSVKSFDDWFNTPFANSGTGDKIELDEEEALLIIRRLHKVLRPFLLRRLKKDVAGELPDKVERVIKVRMSALQSQMYKQMKKYKMIADGGTKNGKTGGVKGLANELMQFRKICQHPFLFENVEDEMNPGGMIDDKLIRTSGKIELLNRVLPKFFATGHRVLIFFQMTKVMDIMSDFLKMMGWNFLRLDGNTKTEERASFVQLFNAKDSEYNVFILSTKAGGLGLNLQSADTVIIFDSDWNPHNDLQAQDRAHRIGQTKAVLILRLITEKSVEEVMYQRARYKLGIDDKVIGAGRFDNKSTPEEQEEFLRSILADHEEDNEEAGDMNDEELNRNIARSEEEAELFRDMDMKRERDALENWRARGHRGKPPSNLTEFEELPECYQKDQPFEVVVIDEANEGRGQRRRKVVSYTDGLDDETWAMALENGEDLEELADRSRKRRSIFKDAEASARGTPISDSESRARKSKGPSRGNKRKKSRSPTPSVDEDDEDERQPKRRKAPPKNKSNDVPPNVRQKMKKIFDECYRAVVACEDEDGRKRCELFKELPDRKEYSIYYQLITQPIALSHLRKRGGGPYYKDLQQYRNDWALMFNNARTFNEEGSWVYNDAVEMEKVLDATFQRLTVGSGLPGAQPGAGSGSTASYESALTPVDEDDRPPPPSRARSSTRRQVISDEDYSSDED